MLGCCAVSCFGMRGFFKGCEMNTEGEKSEKTILPLREASSLQVATAIRQLCNGVTMARVTTACVSMVAQA